MYRPEPADLTQGSTSRISKNSGNSAKLQSQPMVKRDCSNEVFNINLCPSIMVRIQNTVQCLWYAPILNIQIFPHITGRSTTVVHRSSKNRKESHMMWIGRYKQTSESHYCWKLIAWVMIFSSLYIDNPSSVSDTKLFWI